MAEFLITQEVSSHIIRLIDNAKKGIILVSPYLSFNDHIKNSLRLKNKEGLDIRIVYGKKTQLSIELIEWLNSQDHIRVKFFKELHAKCYLNEYEAIITSMNLLDVSAERNHEMGIYVTTETDPELFKEIHKDIQKLYRISEKADLQPEDVKMKTGIIDKSVSKRSGQDFIDTSRTETTSSRANKTFEKNPAKPSPKKNRPPQQKETRIKSRRPENKSDFSIYYINNEDDEKRYCIRCKKVDERIRPKVFCLDCFHEWDAENGTEDEKDHERFCHFCGRRYHSTFDYPVCPKCE